MKELKAVGVNSGLLALTALVLVGSWTLGGHYLGAQDKNNNVKYASCQKHGVVHTVIIQNNKANPQHTDGKLCDTLTITNEDDTARLIAFGPHEDHQPYDGVAEKAVETGQSLTVTLNEAGTFQFHDHIGDIVRGDFTVTK